MCNCNFIYPRVRRDTSIVENINGVNVADPYRWQEEKSDETKAFVKTQVKLSSTYIRYTKYRCDLRDCLCNYWNFPKFDLLFRAGCTYFQSRNTGVQNQNVLYYSLSLVCPPVVLLDPNKLSQDGSIAVGNIEATTNGNILAYELITAGSDWREIRFRCRHTSKNFKDKLKRVRFSQMAWMKSNKGFFYSGYLDLDDESAPLTGQKLYYHKLGSDQSEDIAAVTLSDPKLIIMGIMSDCENYLIVSSRPGGKNNAVHFVDLTEMEEVTGPLELTPIFPEPDACYRYITNVKKKFYFLSNKNAPNYNIIEVDTENGNETKVIIKEDPEAVLYEAVPIHQKFLVVHYFKDVRSKLEIFKLKKGVKVSIVQFPESTVTFLSGRREHSELFFGLSSFVIPKKIYRIDFSADQWCACEIYSTDSISVDLTDYEYKQIFARGRDGTKIPMYVVGKNLGETSEPKPCLLYGYGGFGTSVMPSFSVKACAFIEKFGGIFAVANVRGGGEFGEKWHRQAILDKKQNSFDDFQFAAKHLVTEKYTCPQIITIEGVSNGGLMVAACINQSPQLFGAAICHVGVLDMLRFHKFTIGYAWIPEYGSPDDPEQFKWLYKYSPVHNVKAPKGNTQYPATLLLTGDHDDRVVPCHSFKFISELQSTVGRCGHQKLPLMMRVETNVGHGPGKPISKRIEEDTDVLCFIGRSLNLVYDGDVQSCPTSDYNENDEI